MNLVILKLAAAHFVAWGLIQRRGWLPKGEFRFRRALGGAGLFGGLSFLSVLFGDGPSIGNMLWFIGTAAAARCMLDVLVERYLERSWSNLLVLQLADVLVLCILTSLAFDSSAFANAVEAALRSPATFGILGTYAVSLLLGEALVRLVTGLLTRKSGQDRIGIDGAGSIIGILERMLVTSFVLFWPSYGAAAIGLIFSAKSIARFPEMGKDGSDFAEYYLVGTLTSFTVAIGAAMIARAYMLG